MTAVLSDAEVLPLSVAGGLAGFPGLEQFALVETSPSSPLSWLRSLEEPDLAFLVAPPMVFFPDYAPEIDDMSAVRLGLADAEDALLLVVITVGAEVTAATANLMAPVVVNTRTRQAAQVVLDGNHPLRAPLRR